MGTYAVTVNARVVRTVTVEADTEEQAATEAQAEVMAQLGAYLSEVQAPATAPGRWRSGAE